MTKYFFLYFFIPIFSNAQQLRNSPIEHVETFPDLGTYYNMYVGNRMPFIDVFTMGANNANLNGKFLVDYGTDVSVIDLNGFPGYFVKKNNSDVYSLTIRNGSLSSGPYTQKCNVQDCSSFMANGIREAGIIGTDILSKIIVTLDYDYSRFYIVWDTSKQCKPNIMVNMGFVPVTTKGFYSSDVRTRISANSNIPTIPIVIGDEKDSARALAQIDPGYDDRCHLNDSFDTYYTHILNINQLYYNLLKKKGIDINVDKSKYYTLSNISGAPDTLFKCSFSKRYVFNVIGTNNEVVIPYGTDECNVFLKVNAPGGARAGGITTLPFPAVQFGGSIMMDCRKITFDPHRSLVWFQSARSFKKN